MKNMDLGGRQDLEEDRLHNTQETKLTERRKERNTQKESKTRTTCTQGRETEKGRG